MIYFNDGTLVQTSRLGSYGALKSHHVTKVSKYLKYGLLIYFTVYKLIFI